MKIGAGSVVNISGQTPTTLLIAAFYGGFWPAQGTHTQRYVWAMYIGEHIGR